MDATRRGESKEGSIMKIGNVGARFKPNPNPNLTLPNTPIWTEYCGHRVRNGRNWEAVVQVFLSLLGSDCSWTNPNPNPSSNPNPNPSGNPNRSKTRISRERLGIFGRGLLQKIGLVEHDRIAYRDVVANPDRRKVERAIGVHLTTEASTNALGVFLDAPVDQFQEGSILKLV
ncbi:hypothetical protein CHS0354_017414 [Potamilus streckersoni]|uniref:Uncharacterized protein n=1 Tax=Potamilus streckersoni TaxID=2493646 RepID=A0AAE0RU29_9BIVA|nr:hypothetical protein CHS0354_017414 [Potamilus streckersoni]